MCAAQFHGERSSSFRLVVERAGPEPDPAGCRDHATSDTLRGRREPEHRRYAASALAMPRRNRRSPPSSARGHSRRSRFERESACPPISDMSSDCQIRRDVPQPAVSNRSKPHRYSITSSARALTVRLRVAQHPDQRSGRGFASKTSLRWSQYFDTNCATELLKTDGFMRCIPCEAFGIMTRSCFFKQGSMTPRISP
jgi:hypothetical protein